MIVVSSPLKRDFMVELVDGYTIDNFEFKHVKTEGMKLYFECANPDTEKAVRHVKNLIKGSEMGRALYFTVTAE